MLTIYTLSEQFRPKRIQFTAKDLREIKAVHDWVKNLKFPFSDRPKKFVEVSFVMNRMIVIVMKKKIDVGNYGFEDWVSYLNPRGTELLKMKNPYFSSYFLDSWKDNLSGFRRLVLKQHKSFALLETMLGDDK